MTATTRRTTRQSARNASTSQGTNNSSKETTVPVTKATAKPRKSKAKVATHVPFSNSTRTLNSAQDDANNDQPWYHFFTKGDEEYNHYMATEWGCEKV
jgi:hypothetical protein